MIEAQRGLTLDCDQDARDLSILILAGGKSSRMGQDKAFVLWDDKPLLTTVCEVAQNLASAIQVLSPWPQRYAAIVPPAIERRSERYPGQGPLWALWDGLNDGFNQAPPWVLLLACDMPYLDVQLLDQWRSQLGQLPDTCMAYVPQTQTRDGGLRWEPLCGFYRRSGHSLLQAFLDQGGQSFQRWLDQIDAIAIPISPQEQQMFYNCNAPEDLRPSLKSPLLAPE